MRRQSRQREIAHKENTSAGYTNPYVGQASGKYYHQAYSDIHDSIETLQKGPPELITDRNLLAEGCFSEGIIQSLKSRLGGGESLGLAQSNGLANLWQKRDIS